MKIILTMLWGQINRPFSKPVNESGAATESDRQETKEGQSLVEFAIVLPILMLMLLGVFEVGWALRSYLVLVNVNREATRFASRGVYLDFAEKDNPNQVGYQKVVTHTVDSLTEQLALDMFGTEPNASMIITYYNLKPSEFNCLGDTSCAGFDCSRFAYENRANADYVAGEDLTAVEYPLLVDIFNDPQYPPPPYYGQVLTLTNTTAVTSYHYQVGAPVFSKIDPATKVPELRSQVNVINCELTKKNLPAEGNNVVIVENIYEQPQLVGLPFVTAFVPNPIPFYTHTAMRVTTNLRQTDEDDEALVCPIRPIIFPQSLLGTWGPGEVKTVQVATAFNNTMHQNNQAVFLVWNSGSPQFISDLNNPENVDNTFVEAGDPSDNILNIGDWASASPSNLTPAIQNALDPLVNGSAIQIPVWVDNCPSGLPCDHATSFGGDDAIRVATFVQMKIAGYDAGANTIDFQLLGYSQNICPGDDVP